MRQGEAGRSCLRESIRAAESDIDHANTLAGEGVEMELCYSPFLVFVLEWMWMDAFLNCLGLFHIRVYIDDMPTASLGERKATIKEFYGVIYPMLKQMEGNLGEEKLKVTQPREQCTEEDECGICMETDNKIVLPLCGHSMCLACFNDWYAISPTCPFCRGSVTPADLWVLTTDSDVVDATTLARDNLRRFYLYIYNLPLLVSDHHNLLIYHYLM